jgi:hypothetical protein
MMRFASRDVDCYRLGYGRTLARADRYEAEFAACKALLIAEQKRAERAEAERAEAQRDLRDFKRDCDRMLEDAYQGGKRAEARASEALAALAAIDHCIETTHLDMGGKHRYGLRGSPEERRAAVDLVKRALAALPVEPARRQVTENANALGAPAAGCSEEER